MAFDRALIYATGGFAYGGADDNNGFGFVNDDDVRTGWVLGGGLEYAFTNNLTAGVEGLWVSLDARTNGTFIGTETTPGGDRAAGVRARPRRRLDNEFFVARAKLELQVRHLLSRAAPNSQKARGTTSGPFCCSGRHPVLAKAGTVPRNPRARRRGADSVSRQRPSKRRSR